MKIGIQMYSLRHFIQKEGIEKALQTVADCGYDCIEPTYDEYGLGFEAVGKLMRRNGLSALSAHIPQQIIGERDKLAAFCEVYGIRTAVIPSLSRDMFYDEKQLREILPPLLDNAKALGIGIAYHNHNFEFESDMLTRLPALFAPLKLQPDVFWLKAAGIDPTAFLREHAADIALIHMKEYGHSVEECNPVVGSGTTDARQILQFAKAQKHESIILEYENVTDDVDYMKKSLAFMREVLA